MEVVIVGGGISGLVSAYKAAKEGKKAVLIESKDKLGGMIGTTSTSFGIVESAANGLIQTDSILDLCKDINLTPIYTNAAAKKRYFWSKGKIKQIPVSFWELLRGLYGFFFKEFTPKENESMKDIFFRVFGETISLNIIEPAFGGIYASALEEMDPQTVFSDLDWNNQKSLYRKLKSKKDKKRSVPAKLISFPSGMGELIEKLIIFLEKNTTVLLNQRINSIEEIQNRYPNAEIKIALPFHSVHHLLKDSEVTEKKVSPFSESDLPLQSITSITVFSKSKLFPSQGFGILFPKNETIRAKGVLSNTDIFPGRSKEGVFSETWIYAGKIAKEQSLEGLISILKQDRKQVSGKEEELSGVFGNEWKQSFPIYDKRLRFWNETIDEIEKEFENKGTSIRFLGNYRRGIGLRNLIESALRL